MVPLALIILFLGTLAGRGEVGTDAARSGVPHLLLVGIDASAVDADARHLIADLHVGGVVLYAHNIHSPEQVKALNAAIRKSANGGEEPFIAVDQEGGTVQRLRSGVPQVPGAMAFGATRSSELTKRAALLQAQSLRALGFDMNFAPVLDIANDSSNTAIGTRSYSDDPAIVSELGAAFIQGQLEGGLLPVAKHFPGGGAASGDPHYSLPVANVSLETMRSRELRPFRAAIRAGVPALMTAHVAFPQLAEARDLPATLSTTIMTTVLRKELQFDGLVITDELEMRAMQRHESIGDAAVEALLAGSDMVMVVWNRHDRDAVLAALDAAYASGKLPHAVVERALRRIRAAKAQLRAPQPPPSPAEISTLENDIAAAAVTRVGHESIDHGVKVFLGADGPLRARFADAEWIRTPPRVDPAIVDAAARKIPSGATLVGAITSPNDQKLLVALRSRFPDLRLVLVCLGDPHLVDGIRDPATVIYTYSSSDAAQRAAAAALLDGKPAPGKLPIRSKTAAAKEPANHSCDESGGERWTQSHS